MPSVCIALVLTFNCTFTLSITINISYYNYPIVLLMINGVLSFTVIMSY